MTFARFMSTPTGRGIRVLVGIALLIWGSTIGSATGIVLAGIGLVAFLAGAFNVCLMAPLLGAPFNGKDVGKDVKPLH
jgi:hypothetical protein